MNVKQADTDFYQKKLYGNKKSGVNYESTPDKWDE